MEKNNIIIIPSNSYDINSLNYKYNIKIQNFIDENIDNTIIIKKIFINSFPISKYLIKVDFNIDNIVLFSFSADDIYNNFNENLLKLIKINSIKVPYMQFNIDFLFDKENIIDYENSEIDEYIDIPIYEKYIYSYSGNLDGDYDNNLENNAKIEIIDYKIINYRKHKTGRKIKNIINFINIKIPEIKLEIE